MKRLTLMIGCLASIAVGAQVVPESKDCRIEMVGNRADVFCSVSAAAGRLLLWPQRRGLPGISDAREVQLQSSFGHWVAQLTLAEPQFMIVEFDGTRMSKPYKLAPTSSRAGLSCGSSCDVGSCVAEGGTPRCLSCTMTLADARTIEVAKTGNSVSNPLIVSCSHMASNAQVRVRVRGTIGPHLYNEPVDSFTLTVEVRDLSAATAPEAIVLRDRRQPAVFVDYALEQMASSSGSIAVGAVATGCQANGANHLACDVLFRAGFAMEIQDPAGLAKYTATRRARRAP